MRFYHNYNFKHLRDAYVKKLKVSGTFVHLTVPYLLIATYLSYVVLHEYSKFIHKLPYWEERVSEGNN
jgi:hypothetical protein